METFFADYGALIATITAIVNGFIAVVVAQFFKDRPGARVLLVVTAGVLGAAAISATVLSQRQVLAARSAEQIRQKENRETIGKFMAEGLMFVATCSDNSTPPKWKEMNAWSLRVLQFLQDRLGDSYVTRIGSPAGIPVNVVCRGADEEHNNLFRIVNAMNFRLDQFSSELSGGVTRKSITSDPVNALQ
jgi:hypothetical protein